LAPHRPRGRSAAGSPAAFDLLSPPAARILQDIRIGISQGMVYAGAYGGSLRRSFGALGNEVNIAARLMALAQPGESSPARVAKALESEIDLELRGMHVERRFRTGWRFALRPRRVRASVPLPAVDLVGREVELACSTALCGTCRPGATGVLIEEESGIGKSVLLEHWLVKVGGAVPVLVETAAPSKNPPLISSGGRSSSRFAGSAIRTGRQPHKSAQPAGKLEQAAPLRSSNRVLSLNFPENRDDRPDGQRGPCHLHPQPSWSGF
jgi:hypothetical protein